MPFIQTKDSTSLFYRDWGGGKPVVFCAGWALSSDMWRSQMLALSDAGLRCIAYDRRGHWRFDDPGTGYDYDTVAEDLAALLDSLDLTDVCLVAHSMAGGEVIRHLASHGEERVERIVLVSSVMPKMLAGPDNPYGVELDMISAVRELLRSDYSEWIEDGAGAYFATQFPDNTVSQEDVAWTYRDMQRASFRAIVDLNQAQVDAYWRQEMQSNRRPNSAHPRRCRCVVPD